MATDEVIMRGDSATVKTPDGKTITMPLAELFALAAPRRIDSCGIGIPSEARFAYTRGAVTILACEYPPGPYTLSWIAEDSPSRYGAKAEYRLVTVSLPYVIVLAAYERSTLTDYNECYFRTAPLTDIDSENEMLFPGLLNCSRFKPPEGKPLSWICTQKLDRSRSRKEKDPRRRIRAGLQALRACLFTSSFNYSSDDHEFSSWWTESRGVDPRIETVDRWHEETAKDRFVGLDIPWLKTNMDLAAIVNRIFANRGITGDGVRNSQHLARLMINNKRK